MDLSWSNSISSFSFPPLSTNNTSRFLFLFTIVTWYTQHVWFVLTDYRRSCYVCYHHLTLKASTVHFTKNSTPPTSPVVLLSSHAEWLSVAKTIHHKTQIRLSNLQVPQTYTKLHCNCSNVHIVKLYFSSSFVPHESTSSELYLGQAKKQIRKSAFNEGQANIETWLLFSRRLSL